MSDDTADLAARVRELEAENKALRGLNLSRAEWQAKADAALFRATAAEAAHAEAFSQRNKTDMLAAQLSIRLDAAEVERDEARATVERLTRELTTAKADAWDDGWNEAVEHRTCTYTGPGDCPDAPLNPHRAVLSAAPKPPKCANCGHMPHDGLGWCPNMESDNDCNCTGSSAPKPEDKG